jgi:hypothetical protein
MVAINDRTYAAYFYRHVAFTHNGCGDAAEVALKHLKEKTIVRINEPNIWPLFRDMEVCGGIGRHSMSPAYSRLTKVCVHKQFYT